MVRLGEDILFDLSIYSILILDLMLLIKIIKLQKKTSIN